MYNVRDILSCSAETEEIYQRWKAGKLTNAEAAKECGMPITLNRQKASMHLFFPM